MSAKDFKTSSRRGSRRRNASAVEEHSVRAPDVGETAQTGLKVYRFDLSVAGGTVLPLSEMRRIKRL